MSIKKKTPEKQNLNATIISKNVKKPVMTNSKQVIVFVLNPKVSSKIIKLRQEKEMSQKDLATKLSVNIDYVKMMESGSGEVSKKYCDKTNQILGEIVFK